MLSDVRRGVSKCYGPPVFLFFIKENWICAMTRHHAEPNINILSTRNLAAGSDVRQGSHRLMIPMHFLWAKSNNRARGQFGCDVLEFVVVLISFVRMLGAVVVP